MKILWFINIPLPEAAHFFNEKPLPIGGWLTALLDALDCNKNLKIDVAFPTVKINSVKKVQLNNHKYFGFNNNEITNSKKSSAILEYIIAESSPDIIHLHGSELPYSLIVSDYAEYRKIPQVLSLQGVVSNIAYHVRNTIPCSIYYLNSMRNFAKKDSIFSLEKKYKKQALNEKVLIRKVKNVIGRTSWDKDFIRFTTKDVKYYHCNEILRDHFYFGAWSLEKIEPHTIYFSQGDNPIKGLHILIEAIGLLINKYPNIKLKISGKIFIEETVFGIIPANTKYANHIKKMITQLSLKKNIYFLGILNEERVKRELLSSHVYVMSSFIENSPNSLCEAMILGVPNITSYVGGIPSLVKAGKSSLVYQSDAPYSLASAIMNVFESENLATKMSQESIKMATLRHKKSEIVEKMSYIYSDILNEK